MALFSVLMHLLVSLAGYFTSVCVWVSTPLSDLEYSFRLDEPFIAVGPDGRQVVVEVKEIANHTFGVEVTGDEESTIDLYGTLKFEDNLVTFTVQPLKTDEGPCILQFEAINP